MVKQPCSQFLLLSQTINNMTRCAFQNKPENVALIDPLKFTITTNLKSLFSQKQ